MTIGLAAGALAVACGSTDRTFVPDDEFYGAAGGAAGDSGVGGGDGGGQSGTSGVGGTGTAGSTGGSGGKGGASAGGGGAGAQGGFSGHPTMGGAAGVGGAGAAGTSGGAGASGASGGGASSNGGAGAAGAAGATAGAAGLGGAAGAAGMSGSAGAGGDTCGGCVMPPAAACQLDGATLRTFNSPGTCAGGSCSYSFSDATCPFGCAAGACVQNPCTGTTCSTPPTPVCNGSSVRTYLSNGTCNGSGMCSYPFTDAACPMGCSNGACVTDLCAGVVCNAIPATACTNATTLRTYSGPGMCLPVTGACSYPSTDTACPGGCTGTTCTQCSAQAPCGGNQWCNAGTCASCASACGNGVCDCGETSATCAGDCGVPCPTAKAIGDWTSSDDGWSLDAPWTRVFGYMTFGSSLNAYNKPYTLNLTYGSDVALQGCATATLTFTVRLADDINYSPKTDKSERLIVQCSGDSGMSWVNLTPGPMPSIESSCGTSYCSGSTSVDRSFPWTGQSAAIPAACLSATARFRFSATGKTAWALQSPGWSVDSVTIN